MEKSLHTLDLRQGGREVDIPVTPYSITTVEANFAAAGK